MMDTYSRHHIKIMKAIAIIRQKPDSIQIREYTERLALQFAKLQGNWRHKALKLEQELLHTRQELIQYHLLCPQLRGAELQERYHILPQAPPSTVCSTCTVDGAASNSNSSQTSVSVSRERIRAHVTFLSSVSSLMHSNHCLSLVGVADLRTAVQDTVIDAVKALNDVLESGAPIPEHQTLEAAVTAVRDTIRSPLMLPFESELLGCCEELMRGLVKHLISQQGKDVVLSLQSALCILCSFPQLFSRALDELVDQISTCSQLLQNSLKDVASAASVSVVALATVLTALEGLLSKYSCVHLPQETRRRLLEKLDSSLLGLAVTFPLFSYAVWRLAVYLQPPSE